MMRDVPFKALLGVLQNSDELSTVELTTITGGDWSFELVPPIKRPQRAEEYRNAAIALHERAGVANGSPEWLAWFKSPQGALHAYLTARLIQGDEKRRDI